MLAFIHIEKAAGQTFIRILENNFIYRHCRVAPLKKYHNGIFRSADLKMFLKLNPFLKALAGHSIVPYSDLSQHQPDIRFITILRNPVNRYISHYQYWVQALQKQISFEQFLSIDELKDFQTKKMIGSENISKAKEMIDRKMFLAGIVEEFDNFLVILKNKLAPEPFDIRYKKRNVAKGNRIKHKIFDKFDKYKDDIISNNKLDIDLYQHVKEISFPKEKKYWLNYENGEVTKGKLIYPADINKEILGRIYRNLYIGPITNVIRRINGLKPGGSY